MKRKVNKKKITLTIIILLIIAMVLSIVPTFARYVFGNAKDAYLKSMKFNFSSNFLTTATETTYNLSNWTGEGNYEIDFQLYSYESKLAILEYFRDGLEYTITCAVETGNATAHIDTAAGSSSATGTIPNTDNIKNIKIYLVPTGKLSVGDIVTVKVEAKTKEPYEKTLQATFNIEVSKKLINYSIEDKPGSIYATLKIINTEKTEKQYTLSFNPELIMIDTSDESYKNKVSETTTNKSGTSYVNGVTIKIGAEDVKHIKFYKKTLSADYTYPNEKNTAMAITVTEK